MPKPSALARAAARPFTSFLPKSKSWATKLADRALGAAIAAVGVVFFFHRAPWFIVGVVITVAGLALLVAALFVDVPPPTPHPVVAPPALQPVVPPPVTKPIKDAHDANKSLAELLDGIAPPATAPLGDLPSEEATDAR